MAPPHLRHVRVQPRLVQEETETENGIQTVTVTATATATEAETGKATAGGPTSPRDHDTAVLPPPLLQVRLVTATNHARSGAGRSFTKSWT